MKRKIGKPIFTVRRMLSLFGLSALVTACSAQGESDMARLSPRDYLSRVIALIEKRGLRSSKVDWKIVKARSLEMITEAKSTADTYPAINYVLSELGDNHSFLISRTGSGTRPLKASVQPTIKKRVASPRVLEADGKKFGFVRVGSLGDASDTEAAKTFARFLQQEISEAAQQQPVGWIVDLRGNTGGNMWPMLVGVGPLIGSGTLGFFEYPNMNVAWFYENGEAGVVNGLGKHANFKLDNSIADLRNVPVVVLIDGATASSGEAVTISFKGRANTCLIGSHTRGLSTNNENIKLPDGATLFLTTSGEADRNQVSYDSGIAPDITVEQSEIPLGAKNDPGIRAAIAWLNTHCH
ncbi:MAG: S41 family peptidase [Candidatus Obscuribacterales bacterium]|nr:S41 family peptidase [Candidatus Obscuribacterales bacterium]MBX9668846.1 S41 family peptidase [Candidatus Obscuribacterales bacterium]